MKFGKDEIQKIVLSSLLLAALLYGYFAFLLKPLKVKEFAARTEIEELEPKIRAAKGQITKTNTLEAEAPAAADRKAEIETLMPDGAPVAWFPPRIVDFFKRQGIDKVTVRLSGDAGSPAGLADYRRLNWIIDVKEVQFRPLGIAVAALENEAPLLQIDQMQIETSPDDVEKQHVVLNVSNLVKQ